MHPVRQWFLFCFLAACLSLVSCAGVTPKDQTQVIYSAGWTLVGATNSVADLHDAGVLKGNDYTQAKDTLQQATTAYQSAKAALAQGKTADATTYIRVAQAALNQLAAYLASKQQ